ncbi:MAG: T9SS type A sorting domain-containing protein, partial [Saprospiraceae bacterium]|nr:T9SS type A sorting domain-containing protein [Saprospiraceae bacterium]
QSTYYEVLDAAEANKLYEALKTDSTNVKGWPLPEGRVLSTEWEELEWNVYFDFAKVSEEKLPDSSTLFKVKIEEIDLNRANLKGIVPNVHLDSLRELELGYNEITGISDHLELPALIDLDLRFGKLTSFPKLNAPLLKLLNLSNNQIQGTLPEINFSKLRLLDLANNQLESIEGITSPVLRYLDLEDNILKGTLQNINAPALEFFNISNNRFEGSFDLPAAIGMYDLDIDNNNFTSLGSGFVARFPSMDWFSCGRNKLHFDDLLGLENKYPDFTYGYQQPVPFEIESNAEEHVLTANIGGAENYEWYYVSKTSLLRTVSPDSIWFYGSEYISLGWQEEAGLELLNNVTSNSYAIAKSENPSYYFCAGVNPSLPELKIVATKLEYEGITCWQNDFFSFCFLEEDAEWGAGDNKNEIKATKPLSINGFLNFEGNLTIDTSALKVKLDGKLFIQDIPIPGGGSGNFTLAQGEYELALGGENGKITGFVNDALSTFTPNIGGLDLKLEDLSLVGGKSADGISTTFQVSWDNITPSCGGPDQTTAIKLSGLSITRSSGINVEGMQVTDLGLAPGFCVKDLNAAYSSDDDKLTFGLTLLTPFIEVGGGLGLIGGEIDSVAFKAVVQDLIIPLGTTGVGIIGVEGRINGITSPPPNMKFGGILSSMVNDNLFQLTTSIEYIPPSELKLELGDGKFFNPPFYDDWWLGEGGVYGQLDFKTYRLKLGGELKFSPYRDDDGSKKFMASGMTELAYRTSSYGEVIVGNISGEVVIPELDDDWPYDWINAQLGLPHTISGEALLVYRTGAKYITGNINFGGKIGKVRYDVNLSKRYNEDGFFSFQSENISLALNPTTRSEVEMNIPDNTPLTVVKITMDRGGEDFLLIDPVGNTVTPQELGENAVWSADAENNKGFLTLTDPMSGAWLIITEGMDNIDYYIFNENISFVLEATSSDDGIHVSWDPAFQDPGEFIEIYIDDDNSGMNGSWLMDIPASVGSHTIPYLEIEGFCDFYIMGLASVNDKVYTHYYLDQFSNPYSTFIPIEDLEWDYDEASNVLQVNWKEIMDENLAGYTINRITDDGTDNLAMLYPSENDFTAAIEDFVPEEISIFSYGVNGESSCPLFLESSTSVDEVADDNGSVEGSMKIFPNPVDDVLTLTWNKTTVQTHSVRIYNSFGELVQLEYLNSENSINQAQIKVKNLIPGCYHIQLLDENGRTSQTFMKL